MFIIGLTGSIAMGKTTTARLFAEEGVPVHDADAAVHRLYEGEASGQIEAAFPGSTRHGRVDRVALGKQVVGDPPALRRLEAIVHPLVRNAEHKFLKDAERSGAKVVVLDVPLLFETGGEKRCDAVLVVSAPRAIQLERVLARPGMNPAKLAGIEARQMPDAEKRKRADIVIPTGQGRRATWAALRRAIRKLQRR